MALSTFLTMHGCSTETISRSGMKYKGAVLSFVEGLEEPLGFIMSKVAHYLRTTSREKMQQLSGLRNIRTAVETIRLFEPFLRLIYNEMTSKVNLPLHCIYTVSSSYLRLHCAKCDFSFFLLKEIRQITP